MENGDEDDHEGKPVVPRNISLRASASLRARGRKILNASVPVLKPGARPMHVEPPVCSRTTRTVVERGGDNVLSMRSAGTETLTHQCLEQHERILGVRDRAYEDSADAEQDVPPYELACPMERAAPT